MKKKILAVVVMAMFHSQASVYANEVGMEKNTVEPEWLSDISDEAFHEKTRLLEKQNALMAEYIELLSSKEKYWDLVNRVDSLQEMKKKSEKSQDLEAPMDAGFRGLPEYKLDVEQYKQKIQRLSALVKKNDHEMRSKIQKKRFNEIENSFDNLYLVSVYGIASADNKKSTSAEFFYRGSRIQSKVGDILPGGWKIVEISTTRALVHNDKASDPRREINFKDPRTVKEEIRIKREVDMEIMKEKAKTEGQVLLEQQRNRMSNPLPTHDTSVFDVLESGQVGYR